eukprot:4344660-Heterocapsa_arctica.AAC.1
MKEGLDIDDEDKKNKPKKLKMKFEPSMKLIKDVLSDMERTTKTQVMKDYSMTSYIVSKEKREINLKHSTTSKLKKK